MPKYSSSSIVNLMSADKRLQAVMREVIKHYDCTILQGHRGQAQQDEYYFKGLSKLRWPDSKHNIYPSLAIDVAPYPLDWADTEAFYYMAGVIICIASTLGITLRWGGNWDGDSDFHDQTFMDLVHFEIQGDKNETEVGVKPKVGNSPGIL